MGAEVEFAFDATVVEWRGPAPFYYLTMPDDVAEAIADLSAMLTYGWGCIPATARVDDVTWTTSLFPREGSYLVPLKLAARRPLGLDLGDTCTVTLTLRGSPGAA